MLKLTEMRINQKEKTNNINGINVILHTCTRIFANEL